MKIGICCFPTVGGSGIAATQLAIELAKKDHEVHLISYDTPFLLRSSRHPNITLELVDILSYPLFKDIGVDTERFDTAYDKDFYKRNNLGAVTYFNKEIFGEDKVVRLGKLS